LLDLGAERFLCGFLRARREPANADLPELLRLAVRTTVFRCRDTDNTNSFKVALRFLYKRFPKGRQGRKTPYRH